MAEGLGFHHVHIWDHVLGVDRASRPDWEGIWDSSHPFAEPLTTLAWMAAFTKRIELVTAVLVSPQRQTALLAKQAAQVSVLSGGRLRLGVGVGHNAIEYAALGWPFHQRGRRLDEQIHLLRQLWTQETVTFDGEFDSIDNVGINPLPSSRIPIWIGGGSLAALERVARLGDGWMGRGRPTGATIDLISHLERAWRRVGRAPDDIGIDGRIDTAVPLSVTAKYPTLKTVPPDKWMADAGLWYGAGATHVTFNPLFAGRQGVEHLDFLQQLVGEVGDYLQ